MEIEYNLVNYKGNVEKETSRIGDYLYNAILYKEEKIRLEDQPKVVCEALGRLVERLLDKNVLNLDDFKYIADCGWDRESDSLKLKPAEKEE
jgi:hypothetical protein